MKDAVRKLKVEAKPFYGVAAALLTVFYTVIFLAVGTPAPVLTVCLGAACLLPSYFCFLVILTIALGFNETPGDAVSERKVERHRVDVEVTTSRTGIETFQSRDRDHRSNRARTHIDPRMGRRDI